MKTFSPGRTLPKHGPWARLVGTAGALAVASAAWFASAGDATAREVDPPRAMYLAPGGDERMAGHVEAIDEAGLRFRPRDGEPIELRWEELGPAEINRVYRGLLPRGVDDAGRRAEMLLELARVLRDVEGESSRQAETALRQAVRADPALEAEAEAIRAGDRRRVAAPSAGGADATPGPDTRLRGEHGPRLAGAVRSRYWGDLAPEVMASSIADRKAFAERAQEDLGRRLRLHETDYFLFYSDLGEREAEQWAGLLDKMYRRLAELFAVPDGKNIFRGKAVIFVFQREADYHRFNAVAHQTNSVGSAGLCHGFGDGHVHISFFRQANQWEFAHVLVHESVHGFVHRYRSPARVPSWVNEGLAEYIATQLVPQAEVREGRLAVGRRFLRQAGGFGGMFVLPHIEAWQYGVALDLTEFMVGQSRKRYADFVNGIKDGMTWERSLNENYGVSLERLIDAYGRSIGRRGLTP